MVASGPSTVYRVMGTSPCLPSAFSCLVATFMTHALNFVFVIRFELHIVVVGFTCTCMRNRARNIDGLSYVMCSWLFEFVFENICKMIDGCTYIRLSDNPSQFSYFGKISIVNCELVN